MKPNKPTIWLRSAQYLDGYSLSKGWIVNKDKTFPLASDQRATDPELRAIGFLHDMPRHWIRAQWTGEKRPPRKGEWYLSGAIVEAYKAVGNCETSFHIAKLVRCEQVYKVMQ